MPRWKEEEVEILTRLYPSHAPIEKIGEILKRTHDAVVRKATSIGLHRDNSLLWSDQEVKTLRELYPCTNPKEISFLLNRSHYAVVNKAGLLGLSNNRYENWINDQIISDWQGEESSAIIAARYGITRNQLIGKMWRLGKRKRFPSIHHARKRPTTYRPRQNKPKLVTIQPPPKPSRAIHLSKPDSLNIPFKAIKSRQCRYMEGEDHICCGHETRVGLSWCDFHFLMVYRNDRRTTSVANFHQQLMAHS